MEIIMVDPGNYIQLESERLIAPKLNQVCVSNTT